MEPSRNCIEFIKKEESLMLTSYQDTAGVWTIGWGSTMYKSGIRVTRGEKITREQADDLLVWEIKNKSIAVSAALHNVALNQNQYDALVSFTYNVGVGGFVNSTLVKIVKKNPCDPYIRECFAMWNKITVNGKKVVSKGLTNRRQRESDLYFSPKI